MIDYLQGVMARAWLRFEYKWHMVDEYLYGNQGRWLEAANARCRALDCQRLLDVWSINRG